MKVRFLPEGGFDKNGAFIEYISEMPPKDAAEYQREAFISFRAVCDDLTICNHFPAKDSAKIVDQSPNETSAFLSGIAEIEDELHGRWRLSFLGQERLHDRVRILLHCAKGHEKIYFQGAYSEKDLDVEGSDEFFLEAHLAPERFALIKSEMSEPNAKLRLRINPALFPDFYAEWSPHNRDGRVLKFLNDIRDVENHQDIPTNFNLAVEKQELRSDDNAEPVHFYVSRPLRNVCKKVISNFDREGEASDHTEVLSTPVRNMEAEPKPLRPMHTKTPRKRGLATLLAVAIIIGILLLVQWIV